MICKGNKMYGCSSGGYIPPSDDERHYGEGSSVNCGGWFGQNVKGKRKGLGPRQDHNFPLEDELKYLEIEEIAELKRK
jgi:hypothetical protein